MQHIKARRTWVFLLILSVMMAGCAIFRGPFGSIVPDEAAGKSFESFRMDPTMNYYYSGPDAHPNVIIGLKKSYELDNDLWKPIEPNAKLFKSLVTGMQEKAKKYGMFQYGFVMTDAQGKPLGVWYSILDIKTKLLKMGAGNKVVVYTPELEIYPQDSGGDGGDQGK